MVARWLRLFVWGSLAWVLLLVVWGWWTGWWVLSLVLTAWALGWPVAVIGLQNLLLRPQVRAEGGPVPSSPVLLKAWWTESLLHLITFNWRQPFRARAIPDQAAPAGGTHRRGVVLVHGYWCNRGFWNPWLERLQREGVPFIAVDLEPAMAPLDTHARAILLAVEALQSCTGRPPLVVAHSMGGLAVRAWLRQDRAAGHAQPRAAHVITIASPHQGTAIARWSLSGPGLQMRRGSPWLRELADSEPPDLGRHFSCIYGRCDNIVNPPRTAVLPGSNAVHIDDTPHIALAFHAATQSLVWRWLQAEEPADVPV